MLRSALLTAAGFIHGVSDSSHGNLSFARDTDGTAEDNRRRFLAELGLSVEDAAALSLAHGADILTIGSLERGAGMRAGSHYPLPDADGFFSEGGVALFLLTADCLPVSIADPSTGAYGVFHCGWRSVDAGLPRNAVEYFQKHGSDPANMLVHFGPGILPASYRFNENEIAQAKEKGNEGWAPHVAKLGSGMVSVDIPGYVKAQLLDAGVLEENIEECGIDTAANRNYFSHYRSVRMNEPERRFASVLSKRW